MLLLESSPRAHHSNGEENKSRNGNQTRADVIFNLGRMRVHMRFEIYIHSIYILLLMENCLKEMMEGCSEGAGTFKHENKTMASIFYAPEITKPLRSKTGTQTVSSPQNYCHKMKDKALFFSIDSVSSKMRNSTTKSEITSYLFPHSLQRNQTTFIQDPQGVCPSFKVKLNLNARMLLLA